ncbi:MFS transporter [Teredinibacter turnerae]|uniref:Sugar transporter n=1 Tax=Teredinibacter turnerae (strain ATCC 39867 / T7901) TaxID=377629 RepID=C5BML2_TERTT|nr:glycoside-pentoside-hexuronide (GPH):cation symporter [Teredinibacter turnerae]ACR10806.1 sugar transporter [Teredinibacter turnerae T7901]
MPNYNKDTTQTIPFHEKFGYGLGDFASNLFWMPFVLFGTYFYTDVFGISALSVGIMLLVTRIWDVVNDPVMGIIADRTPAKEGVGKYRPYLFWFAIPFGLIGAIAFFTPDLSPSGKLAYAWVTYVAFGMIYTVINIPYSALMSVMSREPAERNSTSFFRMIGAQSAGLLVSSSLMTFVGELGDGDIQRGFFLTMVIFSVIAVISFILTGKMTRERIHPAPKPKGMLAKDMRYIFTNIPWWILFFVAFFTIAAFTIRFGVAAYYFKYYADPVAVEAWNIGFIEGGAISAFFTFGTIASLLGVVCFSFFAKTIDKKKMYFSLIIISGLVSAYFYYIPNTEITTIIITQAVFSFLTGPTAAILFAMYTDIAAYIKLQTGSDSSALVMSAGSLSQKFGWAVGGSVTGILLGLAGYQPDQVQPENIREIMSIMMSWAPMAACLLGALAMLAYPLDDKKMRAITDELAAQEQ